MHLTFVHPTLKASSIKLHYLRKIQQYCISQRLYSTIQPKPRAKEEGIPVPEFDHTTDEYQYLQKSIVHSLHFQKSLPRLPIPELDKTCQRYLQAQQPLLTKESFKETQKLVTQFQQGIGKDLQNELKSYDSSNKHTSYISKPWYDMYLKDRSPVVVNVNPFLQFVEDPNTERRNILIRATNMLVSALRFYKSLQANLLEPEVYHLTPSKSDTQQFRKVMSWMPEKFAWYAAYLYKAFPLDMVQYKNLFSSTRVPYTAGDKIEGTTSKHMLVMRNGNFYVFDAIDQNGNILDPATLYSIIASILDDPTPPAEFPIGILTTENRDVWADARSRLINEGNSEALKLIDSALFNLVLDDEVKLGSSEGDLHSIVPKMVRHFLLNGDNRWFDKSFSLLLSGDGHAAINFEHAWGDGVAVLRFFNEIFKDSTENARILPNMIPNKDITGKVRRLDFQLSDSVKSSIVTAKQNHENIIDSLNVHFMLYENGAGKNFCKKHKISPDALMQMAFQVAYHKLTGGTCASYESCSTAAFKHGRTECVRPCTMATKALSEALNGSERPSDSEIRGMIENCSKVHSALIRYAAMGQGFDRHLFGLKHTAERMGKSTPAIFLDEAYVNIGKNIISTSTLDVPAAMLGGFGPVVPNGYGLGYVIQPERLGTVLTTYKKYLNGSDYVASLHQTITELQQVLEKTQNK